jgi:zinc protease
MTSAPSAQLGDAPERPTVAEPEPWAFPVASRSETGNGLTVLAYDIPGQYVLSVRVALPMPLAAEPPALEGLATILSRTLDEGTADLSATEFAELLERKGIGYGASMSEPGIVLDLDVSKRHLSAALELLSRAVREPAFPENEVTRHVKTRLAEIEQERANPTHRAAWEFVATFYDPHERASRPGAGTRDTVAAITRQDLVAFHAANLSPHGGTVVVAGDLEGIDVTAEVEAALGGWTGPVPAPEWAPPVAPELRADRIRVVLVDRPGSVQTEFYVGCPGPDRRKPGWAAYPVLGFVVGGSPNARVDAVLREDKGFTYGIRSSFRPRRRGGTFVTSGSVRADATVEALGLLLGILDGARDGFADAEVRSGIDFIGRTAPGRYATADAVADEAATLALEGLTTEFTTATLRALRELDAEQVGTAYDAFVAGEWTVVLVGDARLYAEGVQALGRGSVTVVPN